MATVDEDPEVDKPRLQNLMYICQKVVNDPDLLARDGKTFCNIAVNRICIFLGYDGFSGLIANKIYEKCAGTPVWLQVSEYEAHQGALEGELIVATIKGIPNGHCAVVYPGERMIYSGKWKLYCPQVANVGKTNGIMGASWAFKERPLYVRYRAKGWNR